MKNLIPVIIGLLLCATVSNAGPIVYEGNSGPGHGKHIVFMAGDEEYRSEESLPQMAKILAVRHGFKCTVLFSLDEKDGWNRRLRGWMMKECCPSNLW